MNIDLKKEQQTSKARPRYKYSLAAKFFFLSMDMVTGKNDVKTKIPEKHGTWLALLEYRLLRVRR